MKKLIIATCLLLLYIGLSAQTQKYKGYPDKSHEVDVRPGFINPPKGYGNVPFYWWNGDSLDRNRLKEQLDILSATAVDGFAVSYIHLNPKIEIDEVLGRYGLFGNTEAGAPRIFTQEWWDTWNWFAKECAIKNIGLGLDDYTVGWTGNGYYPDELMEMPKFKNYQGELNIEKVTVKSGSAFTYDCPENLLSAVAWPDMIDLTSHIKTGKAWKVPRGKTYDIYIITTKEGYLIHPDHGKELVRVYFDRFEEQMGDAARNGMNYFFQDELLYPLTFGSWSEDFANEFIKRKGYDILPYLPALKENIGPITPKIRLDYCDVLVDLAEERYMKPIYDWHSERGLIYGSDNLGRGIQPLSYIDYFRINSWYTAPGNDAPSKGSSFLQTKVSSSISHLYERPRTWLEAFHSMGWGSSGEWLTQQMDHHMIAGGNLVCMHGLYYSTHGGWWEWAPPCFHFRMPYWPHMKTWLEYTERMSYLLSQGTHVCDIAIMYPTESMQAYPDANEKEAFNQALKLSNAGLDYDFMNYISLQKANIGNSQLHIGGESYKVIVLADMKAMHHASLEKILAFYRSGGIVLATGELPKASTLNGENDQTVDIIIKEIFGLTSSEAQSGSVAGKQTNASNGTGWYIQEENLAEAIHTLIIPDFNPGKEGGKVLHRRAGDRDIYMVMDVTPDSECFFRSTGKVELWDAMKGEIADFPVIRQTEEGTWLKLEKEATNSYLIVFSPGQPKMLEEESGIKYVQKNRIPIDGEWEVELLPTMNNKWGDFRFPAFDGFIEAEARSFRYHPDTGSKMWTEVYYNDSQWRDDMCGFGPQATLYCVTPDNTLEDALRLVKEEQVAGEIVDFSWQYGVWDNPGSQGYHGLKGKVDDRFFILDKEGHQIYKTFVYLPENGLYRIEQVGTDADVIMIDDREVRGRVELTSGWHSLLIAYADILPKEYYMGNQIIDHRDRGAVVLYNEAVNSPAKINPYEKVTSTRWEKEPHLYFDPYKGKYSVWNYRFYSAPGMKGMEFIVAGNDLDVWINGKELSKENIQLLHSTSSGINTYKVDLDEIEKTPALVAFSIEAIPGYQGTAVITEPVKIKTEKGLLKTGDWSETGALKYYSGGMYYRKQLPISSVKENEKVILDLGKVVATCEVKINDQSLGILMSPPYQLDITNSIKTGTNMLEVLVYSTLANHYQTIPTPYRGEPTAGIVGPVNLLIFK